MKQTSIHTHTSTITGLVSIVIPCYNSAVYLGETLQSIYEQTYPHIEIILVNDGSTDHSVLIAQHFKNQLQIEIIQQKNAGVSAARNHGFLHAKGEYVIFLDSDDLLLPAFVAEKVDLFEQHNDLTAVGSVIYHFEQTVCTEKLPHAESISVFENIRYVLLNYIPGFSTVPSSFMFKSSIFQKSLNTPFNCKLMSTADRYLLLEYESSLKIRIDKHPESGLMYRVRKDSMSNAYNATLINDNAIFYEELKKNKCIQRSELMRGYILLIKSYIKTGGYLTALHYTRKWLQLLLVQRTSP